MTGDVQIDGNISTVYFVPPPNTFVPKQQEWTFSPQSRRIIQTKNVTVKHLHNLQDVPTCTIKSNVPAMVFSLGGLVGNIWHDFSDVIIPLFLASKPLNGEVQFLIRDFFPWFVEKYSLILKDLSNYDIVNLDKDKEVRCYGRATVGLLNHGDLGIHPDRAFDRFDLFRFRIYMREIYSLPPFWVDLPYKVDPRPSKKPRLMLVLRAGIRKFLNAQEVQEMIKKNGFELVVVEPKKNVNLTEFSKLVDSCDVLMGVHGAALTNFFFLRTNAIMIQIIPYGHIDNFAFWYYGSQALEMKLRKIDYTIIPEESSLLEKYGWDHPVIKDPDSVNARGFEDRMKYYWYEQDVRLNVTRFEPVLVKALQLLKQ
ncbi:Glycosyltransferase family 61 protein [Rhynchospora pubera]|uniref:Glycosyltransferase family 61 protein n=1 Tax=Rhynchospora pubera TaxID=906938 RepID=A0AAV8GYP8_9POAL|nr:Glycosyltransferase family 61 protein [Rhynchospora pubera]